MGAKRQRGKYSIICRIGIQDAPVLFRLQGSSLERSMFDFQDTIPGTAAGEWWLGSTCRRESFVSEPAASNCFAAAHQLDHSFTQLSFGFSVESSF